MQIDHSIIASLNDEISAHICLLNLTGEIVYTNHAWNIFGCRNEAKQESWLGVNYFDACKASIANGDQSSQAALMGMTEIAQGTRSVFFYEYPCHSPTEKRWFLLSAKLLIFKEQKLIFVCHQQYQTESELRLYQERLALATEAAEIGIWDLNLKTNELFWDSYMYQLYDLSPSEFDGDYTAWKACIHPDDLVQAERDFLKVIQTNHYAKFTFRIVTKTSQVKYISTIANVLRDKYGNPTRVVGINFDITQRTCHQQQLNQLAYRDQVTHLANRNQFIHDIKTQIKNSHFTGFLLIDIKNFRGINDTFGHEFGDQVLLEVANILKAHSSDDLTVYRIAGDEFLVKLTGSANKHIETTLKALFVDLQTHIQARLVIILKSCIVILHNPDITLSKVLRNLDFSLKECKESTINTCVVYNDHLEQKHSRIITLSQYLQKAQTNKEFSLLLQPQYHEGLGVIGAEVLLRWHHPSLGHISPNEFIPISERTSDIVKIGYWVIEQTCQILKNWEHTPALSTMILSVNISPRQIYAPHFFQETQKIFTHYQIDPERIKFEITESLLIERVEEAIYVIKQFKDYGITFAIDDFGTGYSSLNYLKHLPIDLLKIDKQFIDNIHTNKTDQALLRSVISLCRGLGINIICEGVESTTQHQHLLEMGCFFYQGYLFGKPMTIKQFEALDSKK